MSSTIPMMCVHMVDAVKSQSSPTLWDSMGVLTDTLSVCDPPDFSLDPTRLLSTPATVSIEPSPRPLTLRRMSSYLGTNHRDKGINDAKGQTDLSLRYYTSAQDRATKASRFTYGWTNIAQLLATRAAARLELAIGRLQHQPSRFLYATWHFDAADGSGVNEVCAHGTIIERNRDPISARSMELHDNLAILAHWIYTRGVLTRESRSSDARPMIDDVRENIILPYFSSLDKRAPTRLELLRVWCFVELEYLENWFYYVQTCNALRLCQHTVALQRLQGILQEYITDSSSPPSMISEWV